MRVLLAVIDDLYHFALSSFFSLLPPLVRYSKPALPPGTADVRSHIEFGGSERMSLQKTSESVSGVLYFIGEEHVQLYADPVVAFDVVIKDIPYGEQVRLLKLGGRWGSVRYKDSEGWVFKDALREQARDVFPFLEEGIVYDAQHSESQKLRLCIRDMFCGGRASLLLMDAEYVTYRLMRKGYSIAWNDQRPRTPGMWQKILRGNSSVHLGINPKTDSVMEYSLDEVGYVAYVEAVFPDDTIKISGVGLEEDGVYSERMLSKEAWKELRPVFIEVY